MIASVLMMFSTKCSPLADICAPALTATPRLSSRPEARGSAATRHRRRRRGRVDVGSRRDAPGSAPVSAGTAGSLLVRVRQVGVTAGGGGRGDAGLAAEQAAEPVPAAA